MFPNSIVRIKEEVPDGDPSEVGQSSVFSRLPEICEVQPEFVAVKKEIDPDQTTETPQDLSVKVKRETDDGFLMNNVHPMVTVKLEPVDCVDVIIEPLVGIKKEPDDESTGNDYQFPIFAQPQPPTAKVQCQICKNIFPSLAQLESHIKTHNDNEITYKCNNCNRIFKNRQTLRAHDARGGCKPKPELICQDCGLEFSRVFLYKSHIKIHSEIRPYQCDYCPMAFRHRRTVIRHLTVHTDDTTYPCPVCKEVFTRKTLVKSHIKIHTREHPHTCPICQKTFTFKHNAEKHLLIHCTEKVLTCTICHKTFPRESRLRYHMNSHIKAKPFCCDVCGRSFSHKSNVIRHLIRKHPGLVKDGLYQPFK